MCDPLSGDFQVKPSEKAPEVYAFWCDVSNRAEVFLEFGLQPLQNTWVKAFDEKFGADYLLSVPTSPGVYRYFDAGGEIIYVGKAKNLRRRLTQYRDARRSKRHRKMRAVVKEAERLSFEVHPSHLEACLAEARLIQTLRPRWNVAGAFSFLYPLVGVREVDGTASHLRFCLTTLPDRFPGYRFFGTFRYRKLTREAFFSLMRVLEFVGHPVSRSQLGAEREVPYSSVFGFRRLPTGSAEGWARFFRGESREALEALVLKLIENAGARAKAGEVQEELRKLKRFWKREAKVLNDAIRQTAYETYPVPQLERDLLFLRYRLSGEETA